MRRTLVPAWLILVGLGTAPPACPEPAAAPAVHHLEARVRLEPAAHRIEAEVTLRPGRDPLPTDPDGALRFWLHGALAVETPDPRWTLAPAEAAPGATASGEMGRGDALAVRSWIARPAAGGPPPAELPLRLRGVIDHPLVEEEQEYARSFSRTPGTISEAGVFLAGATWWLPTLPGSLCTFTLEVDLPAGWDAVSQGARGPPRDAGGRRVATWTCPHPMEEVYLVANRYTLTERAFGRVQAQAWLRAPDAELAGRYLEVTGQYLDLYGRLIGPYPFEKFALVENFWETGYGMPSFTLLGPQVIRLPFILHSSYPHEILHNWWGNSVYVDYAGGNWCEGLTAYLADHLVREGQGRGEDYRRDALKGYRAYVGEGKDFPLAAFRSRHSSATQAVGYGKSLMLFHMLRRRLGDARFVAGLRACYRDLRFRRAAFADLANAFGRASGEDLGAFFRQWVERPGAPALAVRVTSPTGPVLELELTQRQAEEPFDLEVPLAITLEGRATAEWRTVRLSGRRGHARLAFDAPVRRVDVDPAFDLFRRLDRAEIPTTFSELFGAAEVTLVVPPATAPGAAAWHAVAQAWARGGGGGVEVVAADRIAALPAARSVWILGQDNPFAAAARSALREAGATFDGERLVVGDESFALAGRALAFALPHPADPERALGWVLGTVADALPGLARKLPHYGRYSWLAFEGAEPANVGKGHWEAHGSPLVAAPTDAAGPLAPRGALPAREPLARLTPPFEAERLMAHVRWLADDAREGRGVGTAGLEASAEYVARALAEAGLEPGGPEGAWFQPFELPVGPAGRPVTLRNVVGVLRGTRPDWAGQSVVVGAHYDHLGRGWPDAHAEHRGEVHNGADDNASGVAVLLELARVLARGGPPARTIEFVAFSGEEAGRVGSRAWLDGALARRATAMINLDGVGRLGRGKVLLLGAGTAREWPHIAMGVSHVTGVESACVADDPGGSDQASFHAAGIPAVQVFTGAHPDYHRPSDDVERIDAEGLVKVATFVRECLLYLAGREAPLRATFAGAGAPGGAPAPDAPGPSRRVSLGTVPDFAHPGPGVRVADVVPGSPAEAAGLRAGDVLLALGGARLEDLRAYQQALLAHAPGDRVRLRLARGDAELEVEVTLAER